MGKMVACLIEFVSLALRLGLVPAIELMIRQSDFGWLMGGREWIYFIGNRTDGTVKIGISNNPEKRFKTLQTGNADDLTILALIPGNEQTERALHRRFDHLHVRGEWFQWRGDLAAFIETL
jgi:hypothetical protein